MSTAISEHRHSWTSYLSANINSLLPKFYSLQTFSYCQVIMAHIFPLLCASLSHSSVPTCSLHFLIKMPFCLTFCALLTCAFTLLLSFATFHGFPKGFTPKLRENIQAWNSPERVLDADLLFHFQDETRALILKKPACLPWWKTLRRVMSPSFPGFLCH